MEKGILKTELKKLITEYESGIKILQERINNIRATLLYLDEDKLSVDNIKLSGDGNLLSQVMSNSNNPDYPSDGNLLDKFNYFDEVTARIWKLNEFIAFVQKTEGSKQAAKTVKNIAQKLNYYLSKGQVIAIKYNGARKYTFYTTKREWIENLSKGKTKKGRILPGREPSPDTLKNLSDEQKSNDAIVWSGL